MNDKSFNEVIRNSLKNDRNPLKVKCSDKLGVKEYIKEKMGSYNYTPKTFCIADNANKLLKKVEEYPDHPMECLLKSNNDSGNVVYVKNGTIYKNDLDKIEQHRYVPYGIDKGEWFYKDIKFKCFTEEYLGHNLTDYKFHCSAGEPRFCQVIRDRNVGQINEVCTDMDGNCYDFHFDLNFKLNKEFKKPKNWERMKEIAKILSEPFDYVRVDMYNLNIEDISDNSLFVGELTFAPRAGRYAGDGHNEAGKLLSGV